MSSAFISSSCLSSTGVLLPNKIVMTRGSTTDLPPFRTSAALVRKKTVILVLCNPDRSNGMAVGNQLPGAVQKTGNSDLSRQETPEFVSRKTVLNERSRSGSRHSVQKTKPRLPLTIRSSATDIRQDGSFW